MSLADLEARVEHEEEGLSCAVEGVARPQRVGQKASEHLEQHGQRARNVRESHRYKNAPTLRVPHPSLAIVLSSSVGSTLRQTSRGTLRVCSCEYHMT